MTRTILVEGSNTSAVDVLFPLTTQGSEAAPGREVPAGFTKIDKITVAIASDGAVDGGSTIIVRIGGTAVKGGSVNIIVGGIGGEQTASADQVANTHVITFEDTDIAVTAGNVVTVNTEYGGVDTGTPEVGVELYFA